LNIGDRVIDDDDDVDVDVVDDVIDGFNKHRDTDDDVDAPKFDAART
jgi:hypothetical protein